MLIYLFLSFFQRETRFCTLKCDSDLQCSNNEKCIKGQCQSGCSNDDHCKQGEKCYQQKCVRSCKGWGALAVCPKGEYCHNDDKVCLLPCKSDKNCKDGYRCSKGGQCLKFCGGNSQCLNNEQYCNW